MRAEQPHVDQTLELKKFRDYWHGLAGAKARKCDWAATYRNWIRRAAERPPQRNNAPIPTPDLRVMQAQALKARFRQQPELP